MIKGYFLKTKKMFYVYICKALCFYCCFFLFTGGCNAQNDIFSNISTTSISITEMLKRVIRTNNNIIVNAVDGKEVAKCEGTGFGTSDVTCYKFKYNGKKIYLKKTFYIPGEKFDSIVASILLKKLSEYIGIIPFAPKLRFAINEENKIIGIISVNLDNFQSIAELYKSCKTQSCIDDKNSKNPFYCFSNNRECLSKPLSLLYIALFLIGGGDTNPGNICINPVDICDKKDHDNYQWLFGAFDIDLSFKKHFDSRQFNELKKYCKTFLENNHDYKKYIKSEDRCARNILHYYGNNAISIQTKHQGEVKYFLETGDSGLRIKNPGRSSYIDYFSSVKFDPYDYVDYYQNPPVNGGDVSEVARKLVQNVTYEELEQLIKNVFKEMKVVLVTTDKQLQFLTLLEEHALTIIKERYSIIKCYADNTENLDFAVLEEKCYVPSNTETELENLCAQDNKRECEEKIKKILDDSNKEFFVKQLNKPAEEKSDL